MLRKQQYWVTAGMLYVMSLMSIGISTTCQTNAGKSFWLVVFGGLFAGAITAFSLGEKGDWE